MRAVLGNRNSAAGGKQATEIVFPEEVGLAEALINVTHGDGVWANHTVGDGHKPAWVASDSESLAAVLADHYGCEVRPLLDPYDPANRGPEKKGGGARRGTSFLPLMFLVAFLAFTLARLTPFLKTNAGNDFQAAQMGGSASATAVAKWVALTANTTAPASSDTTLTSEITTGGGGLIRKAGTYAHTTGVASYTITTTFTANGSDSLPVTIGKRGIFDASSGGNLVFTTLVSPTATLSASGDALTLTDTITL